jgi:purine-nucleoside phosphorylase
MKDISTRIKAASTFLKDALKSIRPQTAVVLGSGFSSWPDQLNCLQSIPYRDIPGFPTTSVMGHKGQLVVAELAGQHLIIMQGRFHYYEGHDMATISVPIRVFYELGIGTVILTNAAGGINPALHPGDLLIINDHINLVQNNPLIGPNLDHFGPRFPDATEIYSKDLVQLALFLAAKHKLTARQGVYAYVSGPCFETPAEISMMERLGADVVGMSTVPEALTARHASMKIIGISLVANLAAGRNKEALTHEEVMKTMESVVPKVTVFLNSLIASLPKND